MSWYLGIGVVRAVFGRILHGRSVPVWSWILDILLWPLLVTIQIVRWKL